MGRQAGEIRIFAAERGKTLFAPGRGKGYCKIAKRAPKMHFLRAYWKFCLNMCNFAFQRHVSYDFYLQYGEKILMTKGGAIIFFWDKGRLIKCREEGDQDFTLQEGGNDNLLPNLCMKELHPKLSAKYLIGSIIVSNTIYQLFKNVILAQCPF